MKKFLVLTVCLIAVVFYATFSSSCKKGTDPQETLNTPTVTRTVSPTASITPSATITQTATEINTPLTQSWHFDTAGNTESWNQGDDTAFSSYACTAGSPYSGAAGLQMVCDFTSIKMKDAMVYNPSGSINLDGQTVGVWVYVPAGLVTASATQTYGVLFYSMGPGYCCWTQHWVDVSTATPDAWNHFTWSPTGSSVQQVIQLGVQFTKGCNAGNTVCSDDWAGTIYVDELTIN